MTSPPSMRTVEARLRDALHARAALVPVPTDDALPSRRRLPRPTAYVAAAAAVLAVIVGVQLAVTRTVGHHDVPPSPAAGSGKWVPLVAPPVPLDKSGRPIPHTPAADQSPDPGAPRFVVSADPRGHGAVLLDSANGDQLGRLPTIVSGDVTAVTAGPEGSTYYLAQQRESCRSSITKVVVSRRGNRLGGVATEVPGTDRVSGVISALAVSQSSSRVAWGMTGRSAGVRGCSATVLGVLDVTDGSTRYFSGGRRVVGGPTPDGDVRSLSWGPDERSLALAVARDWLGERVEGLLLDTHSKLRSFRAGHGFPACRGNGTVTSPTWLGTTGRLAAVCSHGRLGARPNVVELQPSTGKVIRVLQPLDGASPVLDADATGARLLIADYGIDSLILSRLRLGGSPVGLADTRGQPQGGLGSW